MKTEQETESLQLTPLLKDMELASSDSFRLPNYLRIGGQPVVYVFDDASIDWATAARSASGNPLFILDGPSHATSTLQRIRRRRGDVDTEP